MGTQERVQRAQKPAQRRDDQQDQQQHEDAAGARLFVRDDVATLWWPESE